MEFTDSNINEIIAGGQPVMVDFWATWCGPCMAMAPVVEKLAEEYQGKVIIGKYNVDDETDFCAQMGVRGLPTLMFFKNGKAVPELRVTGALKEDAIREKLEKLMAL